MAAEELQRVKEEFENSSFWKFIGLELKELKEGYVSLALLTKNDFINVRNTVHGGIYASILDTTMGMTARSVGFDDAATLHLNIQYLKSTADGTMFSESTIIHQSRNTLLVEGKLMDETGELLAHCTGTFKVLKVRVES